MMKRKENIIKRGRPKGTTKAINRKKILNQNGRIIDYDGNQFRKLLKSGYKVNDDETRLVIDDNFIKHTVKRGRPKGKATIVPHEEKVKNPDTGRLIIKNGATFKTLSKKYTYNSNKNEFNKFVTDPKHPKTKLDVTGPEFKKYEKRGYIYDKQENSIIKPSKKIESAFKNSLAKYELRIINNEDPLIQMEQLENRIRRIASQALKKHNAITFNIVMTIEFMKPRDDGEIIYQEFPFVTKLSRITHRSELSSARHAMNHHINRLIDRYTHRGSGWTINRVVGHYMNVNKYKPLAARSYILLPAAINNRKATINIQNKDDKCFMYCLGRALDPNPEKSNWERVSKHLKQVCVELGLDKIGIPVAITHISKI